jgi:nucleotide-binding universal stress UspA family protein
VTHGRMGMRTDLRGAFKQSWWIESTPPPARLQVSEAAKEVHVTAFMTVETPARTASSAMRAVGAEPSRDGQSLPRVRAAGAPVLAAVDGSESSIAAARVAARLARQVAAPLIFVYVRGGPPGWLGAPYYQRRLDAELDAARHALDASVEVADREGVSAKTEVLEGAPAARIREFASARDARFVVVGARPQRLKKSVSQRVIRGSTRPVVVAGGQEGRCRR